MNPMISTMYMTVLRNVSSTVLQIKLKDIHTKQEFHFPYNDWIRKAENEVEELVFELPTVRPDIPPLPGFTRSCRKNYCVYMYT